MIRSAVALAANLAHGGKLSIGITTQLRRLCTSPWPHLNVWNCYEGVALGSRYFPAATISQKGRFSREPWYGRRIALDPREKVSQKLILVSYLSKGRRPHELRVATKSRSFQRVRPTYDGTRCEAMRRECPFLCFHRRNPPFPFRPVRKFKLTHYQEIC